MEKYTILLFYGLFQTKVQPNKNCGCGTLYVIVFISKKVKTKNGMWFCNFQTEKWGERNGKEEESLGGKRGEFGETKGIKNQKEYSKVEMEKHGKREKGGRGVKLKRSMQEIEKATGRNRKRQREYPARVKREKVGRI